MQFNELDTIMRQYETGHDRCIPDEEYIVVRLDGRGFSTVTQRFEKPFDAGFAETMVRVTKHLFGIGFDVVYGYVQSDEISILLHPNDKTFNRKDRKILSVMAGEASAVFSAAMGFPAAFDSRISQLPTLETVIDYFRWRQEDSRRNSLNAYCYWTLRKAGMNKRKATSVLENQSIADKKLLLLGHGIDYDGNKIGGYKVPLSQINGIGVQWTYVQKNGFNPITKEYTTVYRKQLKVLDRLPISVEYNTLLHNLFV